MVYTVAEVIATVDAPPVSVRCEKLPSGDVTWQLTALDEVQNIEVRAPRETVAGDAQMSTVGGREFADFTVVVATAFTGCAGLCVMVTCDCPPLEGVVGVEPTLYPRTLQSPSKKVGEIIFERKLVCHGRD